MRVSLERSGGFTGRRTTSSIDTDELPADQTAAAVNALEELAGRAPAGDLPSTGEPRYRLTIDRDEDSQVIVLRESQISAPLRPLIKELVRRTRPAGR